MDGAHTEKPLTLKSSNTNIALTVNKMKTIVISQKLANYQIQTRQY